MSLLHWSLIVLHTVLGLAAAGHALLTKREPQTAFGWIAVCLIFPIGGPLLYYLFGINRVRTRAQKLQTRATAAALPRSETAAPRVTVPPEFSELARISDAVTGLPLTEANGVDVLHNGEQAYPAMLAAIDAARRHVYLATYIFETNRTGVQFIDALVRARARGVDVRVLIDGAGELYSRPRAGRELRAHGIALARFLPPRLVPPAWHINLRNHRKILVADGAVAFTGGMNIGDRHLAKDADNPARVVDVHFRLSGPVVRQIQQVFVHDWHFVTGEHLAPVAPAADGGGSAICRTLVDGPDEDLGKLEMVLIGAISADRSRIAIMTPYFLPQRALTAALQTAALRGVDVCLILPAHNNLRYLHWAARNLLGELLQKGVRVYYQPGPFVHTKLFVVDDHYAQVGSANLDPRSLRLNFELMVELYDPPFAQELALHIERVRQRSHELQPQELAARTLAIRLRDALMWLFAPYL
jgi:cardiolipin synthase